MVDFIILADDASRDATVVIARDHGQVPSPYLFTLVMVLLDLQARIKDVS